MPSLTLARGVSLTWGHHHKEKVRGISPGRRRRTRFPRFSEREVNQHNPPEELDEPSEGTQSDEESSHKKGHRREKSLRSMVSELKDLVHFHKYPAKSEHRKPSSKSRNDSINKKKIIRFGEKEGELNIEVFENPLRDPENWWSVSELDQIRQECLNIVSYYRKYRPDFAETITKLAQIDHTQEQDGAVQKEAGIQNLSPDIRGLEVHVVPLLSELHRQTVQAVLQAQDEKEGLPADRIAEIIYDRAREKSQPARNLAKHMGQADRVAAVKASLSRWRRKSILA